MTALSPATHHEFTTGLWLKRLAAELKRPPDECEPSGELHPLTVGPPVLRTCPLPARCDLSSTGRLRSSCWICMPPSPLPRAIAMSADLVDKEEVSRSALAVSPSRSLPHYRVLAVGILTCDVVLDCACYPTEDESIRASTRHIRPGGNATNSLRILAQLAVSPTSLQHMTVSTSLLASLGSAATTAASVQCLQSYGIDTSHCPSYEEHALPTSYIVSSQRSGSRTIVHYRGELPELEAAHFAPLATSQSLYHFEGRSNTHDLHSMMTALTRLQQQQQQSAGSPFSRWPLISLEVEKPREGIQSLLHLPNLLILSRDYALTLHPTATSPYHCLTSLPSDCPLLPQPPHQLIWLCWGAQGAAVRLSDGRVCVGAAESVDVVDSVGAGDTFIAALLYAVLQSKAASRFDGALTDTRLMERLLEFANAVAAAKCAVSGLDLPESLIEQLLARLRTDR